MTRRRRTKIKKPRNRFIGSNPLDRLENVGGVIELLSYLHSTERSLNPGGNSAQVLIHLTMINAVQHSRESLAENLKELDVEIEHLQKPAQNTE